ncbi:MAG: hypothetical protein JJU29_14890 [Verrucomicrobia bacterium]|nr:hypothetical protein [Verrucomicrobiota bacterium]
MPKVWVVGLVFLGWSSAHADGDAMILMNGDTMKGRLGALEKGRFHWTPAWSEGALRIPAAYVREIALSGAGNRPDMSGGDAWMTDSWISWRNGDELSSRLLGMEDDRLLLRFPSEQTMAARVEFLRKIEFMPSGNPAVYFLSPKQEDWKVVKGPDGEEAWTRDARGLHIPAQREILHPLPDLPETFRLQMFLWQQDDLFRADLRLFLAQPEAPDNAIGLLVRLLPGQLFVSHHNGNRQERIHHGRLSPETSRSVRHEVNIYVNRVDNRFHMEFNGERLGPWDLAADILENLAGPTYLSLGSSSRGYIFEQIRVTPWSENFEKNLDAPLPAGRVRVFPWGRKFFDARWTGLDGEGFHFVTDTDETLILPRDAVEKLMFSEDAPAPYRRDARDVRVVNPAARARLTFALEHWDGTLLSGGSEHWSQPLRISRDWVETLQLNVHYVPGLFPPVSPPPYLSPHQRP